MHTAHCVFVSPNHGHIMLKLNTYSYPRLAFHVHQLMQHSAATDWQRTKAGEILWELFS